MPSSNNANAIISISRHAGDYTSQLDLVLMEIYIIVKVLEQQLGKLYLPLATTLPTRLPNWWRSFWNLGY